MFTKLFSGLIFTSSFLLITCVSAQQSSYQSKKLEYTDVKCHVMLTSGKPMISLWRIDDTHKKTIKQWLVGKKVTPPDSTQSSVVYKVFSCVAGNEEFTDAKAKHLDEKTAR